MYHQLEDTMYETVGKLSASIIPLLVLAVSALILRRIVDAWVANTNHGPFPPGPEPRFLVGNLYDLPSSDAAYTYAEWGRRYNCALKPLLSVNDVN